MQVGQIIKELRKNNGYLQSDFADKLDITPTYLSLIEKNKKTPSIDLLQKIGDLLNVPPSVLAYLSTTTDQVSPEKKKLFEEVNPIIEKLIREIFLDGKNIKS